MKLAAGQIRLAATDLAVIRERGERHEREYLAHLGAKGLTVDTLSHIPHQEEKRLLRETLALMERGAEVIAQGALGDGEWFGRPDILRRVAARSKRWAWSYEVADTKLAKETKATTILQLSLYSELLGKIQGTTPEFLWVIPRGEGIRSRRAIRSRWSTATSAGGFANAMRKGARTIICRWWRTCAASSAINLRPGTQEPWRSWRHSRFHSRRSRGTDQRTPTCACASRRACRSRGAQRTRWCTSCFGRLRRGWDFAGCPSRRGAMCLWTSRAIPSWAIRDCNICLGSRRGIRAANGFTTAAGRSVATRKRKHSSGLWMKSCDCVRPIRRCTCITSARTSQAR